MPKTEFNNLLILFTRYLFRTLKSIFKKMNYCLKYLLVLLRCHSMESINK